LPILEAIIANLRPRLLCLFLEWPSRMLRRFFLSGMDRSPVPFQKH
jgi:hypothetical protein